MTCSKCKQTGHNRKMCQTGSGVGDSSQPRESNAQPSQPSQPSSVCEDTTAVRRVNQSRGGAGKGRGGGSRRGNGRGTPFVSPRDASSSQTKGSNSAECVAATGGNKRPRTIGFGVYSDPQTGNQVFNPCTSSERVLQGFSTVNSASPTNIDIGFVPWGLKWKEKMQSPPHNCNK
ncbi:PREDICTED: uncharacterized protein LOC109219671 [Nicotiana attenuata]|uniref:Uncharacterized protein n=1 Tax=Nicotiana attenuata TaxID=49451 RepID=A0A1J6KFZ6_NICAT|nr:PREDICTED: uncharacterized protein LOC109219671 [Nicotiana attenuata]OIT20823.1 hypothetical protein A4A49_38167 [Nicotiana attenuata]